MTTPLPDPNTLRSALMALSNGLLSFESDREAQRFNSESSDHLVSATVDGLLRVVSVAIAPSLLEGSTATLASVVQSVVNAALDQADTSSKAAASGYASTLGLPGLPALGSPVPDFPGFAATAAQLEAVVLTASPCETGATFECRRGNILAVVNSHRRVVALTFDEPLPTSAELLGTQVRQAINCADDSASDPEEDPIIPEVIGTPSLTGLVLYANGTLKLNDRVRVQTRGCSAWAAVVNAGHGETNIGVETDVGNILSRGHVMVRDRGRVHGFIRTSDEVDTQNDTQIDGPIVEHVPLVLANLSYTVTFPSHTIGTIELEPNQQLTAAPGYYDKLHPKSGAQVFFSSGVYYLNEFFLEPQSKLWLSQDAGPIVIWVRNSFTHRGEILVGAGTFPRLFVGYVGTTVAIVERVFKGTLSAPNAKINIATVSTPYEGAFHAKDIEAFPDAKICHHAFELPYASIPGITLPVTPSEPVVDLDFETLSGWSSTDATLSLESTPYTHGAWSLAVRNVSAPTNIVSASFASSLVSVDATRILLDVWVPPNANSTARIEVVVSVPSAGVQNQSLGFAALASLPRDKFGTIELPLGSLLEQVLDGEHNDVSLKLVLDVNAGSGPWYLDRIRFEPPAVPQPTDIEALLSFEDLSKWSSPQVTLTTATTPKTHLERSLRIPIISGWTLVTSVPFDASTLNVNEGKIRIDLWASSNQPNPYWHGEFLVRFDVPSLGYHEVETAHVALTPLAKNTFHTLELALPQNIRNAIIANCVDLIVKPIVNGTSGSGPYFLDHIRFDEQIQLPPASVETLLSFEDMRQWSSSQVTLAGSGQVKTHLLQSLKVSIAPGWTEVVSIPFSSATLSAPQGKVRIDAWIPSNQPNPYWHGVVSLRFTIASLNLYDVETATVELKPLTKNQFHVLEFTLPTSIRDAINGSYPDVVLKVVLNVTGGSGPYYLDHIRFV